VLLPESELTGERLLRELTGLLTDAERLRKMSEQARTLAHPDALERIAGMAVRLAAKNSRA
jgi:UDP-N-acetylglucosamine--N-acetylmuramyl-(pentapeptide) pyrophosphoryl-undecaprenol N-acetylglucosamine transferase